MGTEQGLDEHKAGLDTKHWFGLIAVLSTSERLCEGARVCEFASQRVRVARKRL